MKKIFFIVLILILGGAGYFSYHKYASHSEGEHFNFPLDMEAVILDTSQLKGVHNNSQGFLESEIYKDPQALVDDLQFPISLPPYFLQGEYVAKFTKEPPVGKLLIALPQELSSPPHHPYFKITCCVKKTDIISSTEYMGLFQQVSPTLTKPEGLTILRSEGGKGKYYGIWKDKYFLYELKNISSQEELEQMISSMGVKEKD